MRPFTFLFALLTTTTVVAGAQAPRDTVTLVKAVADEVSRIGFKYGERIWPGFRPDTIPLSFVLPSRGDLLAGWMGELPTGYVRFAGHPTLAWREQKALGAASTATSLEGRRVAQVVVSTLDPAMLTATAVHEAFHVLESAAQSQGRRFGKGESSILISSYPVFDVGNETAFALEGKLLSAALEAKSQAAKRELARQFVAVRRERHRALPVEFSEFDQLSELNEGLAEYALVRALKLVSESGPVAWRAQAKENIAARMPLLERLTESENLSLRFRFYQTGPAQGQLLDALVGEPWKEKILRDNSTLQDMLAVASGVDEVAIRARVQAMKVSASSKLPEVVKAQVERLKASRRVKADSLMSRPGMKLVMVADLLPGKDFNSCGYDPQNILQVSPTVRMQMRWWRPCAGGPTSAEFNVPSVHDSERGTITAVIGPESELKLTSNGAPITLDDGQTMLSVRTFKLEAPRASVDAAVADVTRRGSTLEVHPKRAP